MQTILLLIIAVVASLCVPALAQKEMLTKEETINYLNKKLQETDGRDRIESDGRSYRYSNLSFLIKGDNIELKYKETRPDPMWPSAYETFLFNPGDITRVSLFGKKLTGVGEIWIGFSSKTARRSCCSATANLSDVDYAYLPYFAGAPDNFLKIEKALLHLRNLAKAEDDPFGN